MKFTTINIIAGIIVMNKNNINKKKTYYGPNRHIKLSLS